MRVLDQWSCTLLTKTINCQRGIVVISFFGIWWVDGLIIYAIVCLGSGVHTAASSSVAALTGCLFWLGSTTAGGGWCGWRVSSYCGPRVPSFMSWLAMNVSEFLPPSIDSRMCRLGTLHILGGLSLLWCFCKQSLNKQRLHHLHVVVHLMEVAATGNDLDALAEIQPIILATVLSEKTWVAH